MPQQAERGTPPCLPPGSAIRVRKLRPDGSEVFAWEGEVLRCDGDGIVLRALFNVPEWRLGAVTICRGDVFHEFYYWDRWYNVFQVSAPDGRHKGWYCNVGSPAELDAARGELRYADWALDVWADPSGAYQVMDEDEFAVYVAEPTHPPSQVAGAHAGRADLLALAAARRLPRWPE